MIMVIDNSHRNDFCYLRVLLILTMSVTYNRNDKTAFDEKRWEKLLLKFSCFDCATVSDNYGLDNEFEIEVFLISSHDDDYNSYVL